MKNREDRDRNLQQFPDQVLKNFFLRTHIITLIEIVCCFLFILSFISFEMNSSIFHVFLATIEPISIYLILGALSISSAVVYLTWIKKRDPHEYLQFPEYINNREIILILLTLAVCLFTIPIIATWSLGDFHQNNVGGLLPIFDAAAYYSGAEHFLDTGKLDAWSQRRPLTSVFLATRLLLTNFDFRSTLLLQTAILGISVLMVSLTISRTMGRSGGFLMFAVLFALSSFYLPDNLSECFGLIFGCLSFSLIWLAIFERNFGAYLFGLFFLTIGFLIRPGPFLLFPALFLIAGYLFSHNHRFNWKNAFLSSIPLGTGILLNQLIIWLYGDGKGLAMGNYATVFYGLATGGKGWQQSMIDFPYESTHYAESQLGPFLYQKSFDLIYANPMQFIKAIFHGYLSGPFELINQFYQILIEYSVNSVITRFGFVIFLTILFCLLIGMFRFFLYSDLKYVKILFTCSVFTTFFALPFFFADGGIRTLVIIFPYFAIGIVIGTLGWKSRLILQKKTAPLQSYHLKKITVIIGLLILVAVGVTLCFGPELRENVLGQQKVTVSRICSINETNFNMRVDKGIPYLEMMEKGNTGHSFAPNVYPIDFTSSSNERYYLSYYYGLTNFIDNKDFPVLFNGYDLNYHQTFFILAPKDIITSKRHIVQFCAEPENPEQLHAYRVYKLNSSSLL